MVSGFRVTAGAEAFDADNVILATGAHRVPRTPDFAGDLSDDIVQLHSADYRNPGQLEPGTVLLVGAGNTGAEIAMDVAPTHQVLMAGRTVGEIPIDIRGWQGRLFFPVLWWVWEHIVTERTKPGRKVQAEVTHEKGEPWVRQKEKDIQQAGVERTSRITGVVDGRPRNEDGEVLEVANVIWCTGFEKDYGWIDLPGLDSSGRLDQRARCSGRPARPLRAGPGVPVHVQLAHGRWSRQGRGVRRRAARPGAGRDAARTSRGVVAPRP